MRLLLPRLRFLTLPLAPHLVPFLWPRASIQVRAVLVHALQHRCGVDERDALFLLRQHRATCCLQLGTLSTLPLVKGRPPRDARARVTRRGAAASAIVHTWTCFTPA